VLVVRGFSKELFWGVPLTSKERTGHYYYQFKLNGKISTAIISQLRTYDTSRISGANRLGKINEEELLNIKRLLKNLR
jgi:mRNA interferase MazF